MNKQELIQKFDDFVLRNAKHVCSVTGLKALSYLADARVRLPRSLELRHVASDILSNQQWLFAVVPSIKHPDYQNERDALNELIQLCNENI